jgi:hypothetical protein
VSPVKPGRRVANLVERIDTRAVEDGIAAGTIAAIFSGAPSTLHAVATGGDPLEASTAAGSMVLRHEERTSRLLLAATPVHLTLSLGWGVALAAALPRRRTVAAGALAGLAIAGLDLGLVGRRFERIRSLAVAPQIADHLAFGLIVGAVVKRRRRRH